MKITNKSGLPQAVVHAVTMDDYDRGDCHYTVTELLKPPRVLALQAKYKEEIESDVEDMIYALEGKILHKVLENADRHGLVETRFFGDVEGYKISAQIDTLAWDDQNSKILSDWKRCSVFKLNKVDADWAFQLNVQAYLLKQNGLEVDGLQIVAFAKDHSKVDAVTQKNYPKTPIAKIPIEAWSEDKTKAAILERIYIHENAKKNLPECTDEERWRRFNRKFGRITPLRCLFYCSVSKWCDQYKKEKEE